MADYIDTAPRAVQNKVRGMDDRTLCGQRINFTWVKGPKKGLPVTTYCQVPACIDSGRCPEPLFVPHMEQYDKPEDDPTRRMRRMDEAEVVAAVREAARLADGAAPERRSDKAIARYVGQVWRRTVETIRGQGQWTE